MRIAIDISQIVYGTGVSVYTKNLVRNLLKIDSQNEYILFAGSLRRRQEIKDFSASLKGAFQERVLPIPPVAADWMWNRLHTAPIEWFTGKIDVFHSSDWTQPPSNAYKITTVHDLAPILFPETVKRDAIRNITNTHMRRLAWVKKEVDRIIVPSVATKNDLIRMDFDESKIRVIPEAVEGDFRPAKKEEIELVKKKYQLFQPYIMTVGIGGRKNTERLLGAFDEVRVKEKIDLVLVGSGKFPETRGVRHLGHIGNPELAILYSGAEAFVYPSLYEGFGLPILQAFACEVPVVTSNISSMPEVAGEAAVLVDPNSVDSIVEGVKSALRRRDSLIKLGRERVKEFSWENTAKKTLEVYLESHR